MQAAFKIIQKPFSAERLVNFVHRAIENIVLKKEKHDLESKLFHSYDIIGKGQAIEKIRSLIAKLSNTESRIFISGPAGSGKELVARQIHKQSSRSNKPFVVVNGALLDPQNYELELFGSENANDTTTKRGEEMTGAASGAASSFFSFASSSSSSFPPAAAFFLFRCRFLFSFFLSFFALFPNHNSRSRARVQPRKD